MKLLAMISAVAMLAGPALAQGSDSSILAPMPGEHHFTGYPDYPKDGTAGEALSIGPLTTWILGAFIPWRSILTLITLLLPGRITSV